MKMKLSAILLVALAFITGNTILAQENVIIKGTVTAFKSIPLNKVNITSQKTGESATTDASGNFDLKGTLKDVLTVSALGFEDKKVKTGKRTDLNIKLVYINSQSNFKNAVEAGHISSEKLMEAIRTNPVKGEKDYSQYKDIYELIDNEIQKVIVDGTSITSRTPTSLNLSQQVLYDVDDIIVSDISFVKPVEVQSIRYISGVDASTYGVRGANGVIKIVRKK